MAQGTGEVVEPIDTDPPTWVRDRLSSGEFRLVKPEEMVFKTVVE